MGRILHLDQKAFSVTIGAWGMGYFLSIAHSSWRISDCHGHYCIKAMVFYGIKLVFYILALLAKLQQGISEVLLCMKRNGCLPDSLRDKITWFLTWEMDGNEAGCLFVNQCRTHTWIAVVMVGWYHMEVLIQVGLESLSYLCCREHLVFFYILQTMLYPFLRSCSMFIFEMEGRTFSDFNLKTLF